MAANNKLHLDVERRSAAEKALEDAEEIFKLLISAIEDYAIFALDPKGNILTWNTGAQRLKGYTADEIIGSHFSRLYTPEDIARGHPEEELRIASYNGKYQEEGWQIRKDGSRFWANVLITALKDSQGKLLGFANVTHELSQKQVIDVLESMADGFIALDKDYTILRVNKNQEQISGLSRDRTVGRNHWNIWPKNTIPKIWEAYQKVIQEQVPVHIEEFFNFALKIWLTVDAYPTPTGGIAAFFRDITEQKNALSLIHSQRERFSRLATASGIGVWYCDLPFADLIWDKKVKEHFWLPASAHVTIDTFYERIHPQDRERTKAAIDKSIQSQARYDIEYRTTNPNNTADIKWVRALGWTDYDPSGVPIRFDGITLDITANKTTEANLQKLLSEKDELNNLLHENEVRQHKNLEVMRALNEIAPTISAELDLKKVVQLVTDVATRLSGAEFGAFFYNVKDEKNESYMLYTLSGVPQDSFSKFPMPRNTAVFAPTFAGTEIVRSDNIRKDPRYGKNSPHFGMPKGHLPVTSYLAIPVISRSGEVLGGLFLGHSQEGIFNQQAENVVKGLAAQAAIAMDNAHLYQLNQDAIRIRDEFLSIASHELKTPLTGMKLQTQMYNRMCAKDPNSALEPQKVSKLVGILDKGLNRMERLVEDMLDVSRIQSGKLTFYKENTEIASVISEVMERLQPELAAAGIDLSLELTSDLFAKLDRFRIEQILTNLTTNVIRYAHHKPVCVKLTKIGDRACIRFQDQGPGISKEDHDKIFRRFERLIPANKVSGMGLGLYICKEIVEGHGGTIRLDYEDSPGACFAIELPLEGTSL